MLRFTPGGHTWSAGLLASWMMLASSVSPAVTAADRSAGNESTSPRPLTGTRLHFVEPHSNQTTDDLDTAERPVSVRLQSRVPGAAAATTSSQPVTRVKAPATSSRDERRRRAQKIAATGSAIEDSLRSQPSAAEDLETLSELARQSRGRVQPVAGRVRLQASDEAVERDDAASSENLAVAGELQRSPVEPTEPALYADQLVAADEDAVQPRSARSFNDVSDSLAGDQPPLLLDNGAETLGRAELAPESGGGAADAAPAANATLPPAAENANAGDQERVPALKSDVAVPPAPSPEAVPDLADGPEPSAGATSLLELEQLAYRSHPRLISALQAVEVARGRAVQVGLYPNPLLTTGSPQWAGRDSQYNVFVGQDIVTAGKLRLNRAIVEREVQQAELAWTVARFQLAIEIRRQFYLTLAAQYKSRVLQRIVQINSRSLETTNRLRAAGQVSKGDVLLLEIELDRAVVALRNADEILRIGKRQLSILVAQPELLIEELDGDLRARLPDYDLDQVEYLVLTQNAAAAIARVEVDRSAVNLQRQIVEPIPNVNVGGGYQRQVDGTNLNQGLFQVGVIIPLWNRNQGNIYSAQSAIAGARANVERIELDLRTAAAQSVAQYRTASQRVEQFEELILPKARETLRISQLLYAKGEIDFLRLLQAQRTLLEAELTRIDAQEFRWTAASTISGLMQDETFPQ